MSETETLERERISLLDRLMNEVSFAIAFVSGIVLATGFALTWARIENEGLPSQMILSSLPETFFIQVGLQSMLSPLFITLGLGLAWVLAATWRTRAMERTVHPLAWGAFGVVLGVVSCAVAQWVNRSTLTFDAGDERALLAGSAAGGALVAALAGHLIQRYRVRPHVDAGELWKIRAPIAGLTLALCFTVACTVRVVDALIMQTPLPLSQAIIDGDCISLTKGKPPGSAEVAPTDANTRPGGDRCQIGGFYLGANDNSLFLAQRKRPCPGRAARPPQLVVVPRSRVATFVLLDEREVRKELRSLACGGRGRG